MAKRTHYGNSWYRDAEADWEGKMFRRREAALCVSQAFRQHVVTRLKSFKRTALDA